MSQWRVNMVTAFGRGEALAMALQEKDFDVHIFDLTQAFPLEFHRGVGPFPIPQQAYLGTHLYYFSMGEILPKGFTVWLNEGPLEFAGPMAQFYATYNEAFRVAVQGKPSAQFKDDWLRRLLRNWISPYHHEPWMLDSGEPFPVAHPLVLISRPREKSAMGFDRLQGKGNYHECSRIVDLQIESGRLQEMEVTIGKDMGVTAPQWIWCLSSEETEMINPHVAEVLFSRDIRRAEWVWIKMDGRAERGPWNDGFAKYLMVVNDIHLPWVYANAFILEWLDKENFSIWLKVPSGSARDDHKRSEWAEDVEKSLNARLNLAKWKISATAFSICPHSPVFPKRQSEWKEPGWRNWDWIAPETISRLDFGARFQREVQSFQRLLDWRADQLKKQGAQNDQALHAP